jgi:hypothetical protein
VAVRAARPAAPGQQRGPETAAGKGRSRKTCTDEGQWPGREEGAPVRSRAHAAAWKEATDGPALVRSPTGGVDGWAAAWNERADGLTGPKLQKKKKSSQFILN